MEWNEDGRGGGGCIWWDEESDSPLWRVSGYRSKNVKAAWNADLTDFSDVETREEPGFSAHWGWKELEQRTDPEKLMYQVLGEVAAGPTLFVFTVTFSLPEEAGEHLCPDPPDRGGGERGGVTVEKRWIPRGGVPAGGGVA